MRLFAKNLRTFLLALALGISVWVSAVSAADPNETQTYPKPIPLEVIGQDPSLLRTNEIPSSVQVRLRAPHSVWEALTARDDSVRAILDLSGLSTGEHILDVQLMISERPYQLILVNPSTVTVTLEANQTQTFPLVLSLTGQPAAGYKAGDITKDVTEVTVSGSESLVQKVARVRAVANLDNVRESIDETLPIQVVDSQGNLVTALTINPETVHVSIPISQQGGFRDVAVKVVVQGQQAPGYRIENISVFPPVITIFSEDPKRVNELPLSGVVETLPLDLQDRNEDISTRLSLDLPKDITIVGQQTVQVQVSISPIQTSITLPNLPVDVTGVAEGLAADVFPRTVDVILSGPVPVLEAISSEDVTVSVDVSQREIGVYQLTPEVATSMENVSVQTILPSTVEVVIAVPSTPTPTAFPP